MASLKCNNRITSFQKIAVGLLASVYFVLPANAAPFLQGLGCQVIDSTTLPSTYEFFFPIGTNLQSITRSKISTTLQGGVFSSAGYGVCNATTSPTTPYNCPGTGSESNADGATNYLILLDTVNDTYCAYQYDVDTTALTVRSNAATITLAAAPPVNPTSVPIFTPLGFLAMVSGLFWLGKRRKKLKS